uniref:Phlebovirus glycoprotein G2 fusion domain-containing protein n=1 Tax=Heterorhabditis bacteriophora TaxID=37862 RepID=A0A1I7WJ71_HETBA
MYKCARYISMEILESKYIRNQGSIFQIELIELTNTSRINNEKQRNKRSGLELSQPAYTPFSQTFTCAVSWYFHKQFSWKTKGFYLSSCTKTKDDDPSFVTLPCECYCLRSNYNCQRKIGMNLSVCDLDSGESTIGNLSSWQCILASKAFQKLSHSQFLPLNSRMEISDNLGGTTSDAIALPVTVGLRLLFINCRFISDSPVNSTFSTV